MELSKEIILEACDLIAHYSEDDNIFREQTNIIYKTITELRGQANQLEGQVEPQTINTTKVIANDTIRKIIIDAHMAGQTVIAGDGGIIYAEKYCKDLFAV